ncbi:MAG: hypothetical protein R2730_05310 [Chitinophagales bacterium]
MKEQGDLIKPKNDLPEKSNLVITFMVIFCSIAPFLYLSFFAYPNAEDISLSTVSRDLGVFASMRQLFIEFDGRYFTNFIFGFNPLVYDCYRCYPFVPFVFLIIFLISNYFVVKRLSGADRITSSFVAGLLSSFYLVFLPSTVHGIYWVASSIVFFLPIILLNFLAGTLIAFYQSTSYTRKVIQSFFIVLLTVAIIGTNEMFLLIINGFYFTLLVYAIWRKHKSSVFQNLYFFSISILASINFIIAPGIRARWEYLDGDRFEPAPSILEITFQITKDVVIFSGKTLIQPYAIILIIVVSWWVAKQITIVESIKREMIGASFIMMIGLYFTLFAYYIPMGYTSFFPYRVFNVFIFFFLISIVLVVVAVFRQRLKTLPVKYITGLTIVLFMLIPFTKNTATGYRFIFENKHHQHKREMLKMLDTLSEGAVDEIVYVQNPTNMESIISYPPYVSDSNEVWNMQYAEYFHVKGVRLKDPE